MLQVGSSTELTQHLAEPVVGSMRTYQGIRDDEPMHLFDIRRSNSVTELWKRYECSEPGGIPSPETEKPSHSMQTPSSAAGGEPESLLEAFETAMAKLMEASEREEEQSRHKEPDHELAPFPVAAAAAAGPGPSPSPSQPRGPASSSSSSPSSSATAAADNRQQPSSPTADMVASVLQTVVGGASELGSRFPELAEQQVPEHVATGLHSALTALGSQAHNVASALNSLSTSLGQQPRQYSTRGNGNGTPLEHSLDSLQNMAFDISQMGRTLFDAFSTGFGVHNRPSNREEERRSDKEEEEPKEPQQQSGKENVAAAEDGSTASFEKGRPAVVDGPDQSASQSSSGSSLQKKKQVSVDSAVKATSHPRSQSERARQSDSNAFDASLQSPSRPFGGLQPEPQGHFPSLSRPSGSPTQLPHMPPPPRVPSNPFLPRVDFGQCFGSLPRGPPSQSSGCPDQQPPVPDPMPFRESSQRLSPVVDGPSAQNNTTLFVGNVGYNVTMEMIRDVCASKGFLVDVEMYFMKGMSRHLGFAKLHFPSVFAARAAIEALQGAHIDGHAINLEVPHPGMSGTKWPSTVDVAYLSSDGSSHLRSHSAPEQWLRQHPAAVRRESPGRNDDDDDEPLQKREGLPDAAGNSTTSTTAILDEGSEDAEFSARYPSLLPKSDRRPPREKGALPDRLPHINPEVEMRRFPPVSQLEAQIRADQLRRARDHASSSHRVPTFAEAVVGRRASHRFPSPSRGTAEAPLRRSNTVLPATTNPERRKPFDFGGPSYYPDDLGISLRRRLTERINLRRAEQRAEQMERLRFRTASSHRESSPAAPISSTTDLDNLFQGDAKRRAILKNCVATLLALGYGKPEDGGPDRLAVYVSAADGKVMDAIDMIEEERKAYGRQ